MKRNNKKNSCRKGCVEGKERISEITLNEIRKCDYFQDLDCRFQEED